MVVIQHRFSSGGHFNEGTHATKILFILILRRMEITNVTFSFCPLIVSFVPLPKSATPSRIQSNARLYDFELSEEDLSALDGLDKGKAGSISWNPVDAD